MLWLLACAEPSLDEATARRWAVQHAITLDAVAKPTMRLLAGLPSQPGDTFTCGTFAMPPAIPEAQHESLRASLCHQQEALWNADRHDAEEKEGTQLLTEAFRHYGVVGIRLDIAGPDGIEWSDFRGITRFADEGQGALPAATSGIEADNAQLGVGFVDLRVAAQSLPALHPALQWRSTIRGRRSTATIDLFVQMDGHPDADFVRSAMSR